MNPVHLHVLISRTALLLSAACFALAACGGGAAPAASPGGGNAQTSAADTASTASAGSGASAGSSSAMPTRNTSATQAAAAGSKAAPTGSQAMQPAGAAGMSAADDLPAQAGSAATPAAGSGAQPAAAGAAGGADPASMMTVDSSEPMPSMGCSGGSLMPGRSNGSIQSSGGNRTYIQYVPSSYDGKKPVPLVVDLHPFSVGASFAESSSGFRQLADMEGYVYLAPQGMSNMWDSTGDVDEKFIRDLVGDIAANGCIDLRRVYATGCSNGGAFSFLLMCTAEDIFAAVAPMCGTAFVDLETNCMMDRPVSMLLRLGRQDTLNCWEGEGMVLDAPNVPAGTRVPCAKTVQKILVEKFHCKGAIQELDECELVGDCEQGAEVEICYQNTGHVVYQSNTARDTYDFLRKFYKP